MQIDSIERKIGFRNKSDNGKIYFLRVAATVLYLIVASAFIPISFFSDIFYTSTYINFMAASLVTVAGIGLCIKLTGASRPIVPFCIISGVLIFFSSPTATLGAAVPVFFSSVVLSAYLIREKMAPLALVSGLLGAIITYFLTGSPFSALVSLLFIPLSVVLHFVFKKGKHRVSAVCSMSFALGAPIVAIFLSWVAVKDGGMSFEIIKNFFDTLRDGLIKVLAQSLVTSTQQLGEAAISIADATTLTSEIITTAFNLLPALFIILLFVSTYLIHSLYISVITPTLENKEEILNAITFKMSTMSAVFFLLSFIISLILQKSQPQISVVTQNLYTIFYPGLTMVTFGYISSFTKGEHASCMGSILYMAMLGLVCFLTDIALLVASIAGAILIIVFAIRSRSKNTDNNNNNSN